MATTTRLLPRSLPPPDLSGAVIGIVDRRWEVEVVSVDAPDLLGVPTDDLLHASLLDHVHPEDQATFLSTAARCLVERASVSTLLRVGREGGWSWAQLVLSPVAGLELRFGFMVASAEGRTQEKDLRATRLEQHLWHIAREIEAVGLVTDADHAANDTAVAAELADLSPRQWEVLRRLLQGERVPGIARSLYLSASTVRNHLTAIFAKVGVHSQEELIRVLRTAPDDTGPSAT